MGASMIREARGQLATELEVAKIDASYEVVYPPGHSNLPVSNAELVILLPRQHLLVRSPTLVFSATSSGSISIDSTGTVKVSGDPSVSFTACESSDELHRALTSTRTNFLRTDDATLLASAAHIVIVPNTRSPLPQELSIPLGDLAAVSRSSLPLCLYSAPRRIAAFFSEDELVSIMVGPNGGHLLVVPMNEMIHDGQRWHVGIASPRSYSAASTADVLPTPPPSPRLRPLTHRYCARSCTSERRGQTPSKSVRAFGLRGIRTTRTPSTDERTPLLAEREPPVVHVVETPTSQPALSANVEGGKVTILMHGATPPTQVRIQLDGKDVDKQMHKINDLCYATEFSSKSGGRLTVGC
ncbi:hypothetical protein C8F01DRAFT_438761 [Mycena amicta]|nr:hypothetical protein C8F01DRAFT_438761 [Mycena amicta]